VPGDGRVGVPFGDVGQHFALAARQRGPGVAAPPHQLGEDLGVDGGPASGDAAQRIGELLDVTHSVLEQVAQAAAATGLEQVCPVAVLDVLAEHDQR
jgi:hypothetical protein